MIDESQTSSQTYDENHPPSVYKIKQYQPPTLFQSLGYMLVRPPRFMYNQQLLIPPVRLRQTFTMQVFQIPFKLTLYSVKNMKYVILYLHGNSSSRFQGYMQLRQLPIGVGLACFDFSGCGMRFQSKFITLGYNQCKDVDIAVKFLKVRGHKVVGWGRSMGSVSLLLSSQCDIMIADSPFSSLNDLCEQSSFKFLPKVCCCLVKCFYPCFFSCVKSDVLNKAGFNTDELEVAKILKNNEKNKNKSLFILAGKSDTMILPQHSKIIYQAFPGKKKISIFEGTHNSNRPRSVIKQCIRFIQDCLGLQHDPFMYVDPCKQSPRKQNAKLIRLKPIEKPGKTKVQQYQLQNMQNNTIANLNNNQNQNNQNQNKHQNTHTTLLTNTHLQTKIKMKQSSIMSNDDNNDNNNNNEDIDHINNNNNSYNNNSNNDSNRNNSMISNHDNNNNNNNNTNQDDNIDKIDSRQELQQKSSIKLNQRQ